VIEGEHLCTKKNARFARTIRQMSDVTTVIKRTVHLV